MNRQLIILRHGEAAYGRAGEDVERALTPAGAADVSKVTQQAAGTLPADLHIVSSTARRAFDTAVLFAAGLGLNQAAISKQETLYEASVKTLLKTINAFPRSCPAAALVGHNPGLTELANYLCDAGLYNLGTAGLLVISFPFDDWRMVSAQTGTLVFTAEPDSSF